MSLNKLGHKQKYFCPECDAELEEERLSIAQAKDKGVLCAGCKEEIDFKHQAGAWAPKEKLTIGNFNYDEIFSDIFGGA
jgi:uncharacterized CHY-type Zn-finger protein